MRYFGQEANAIKMKESHLLQSSLYLPTALITRRRILRYHADRKKFIALYLIPSFSMKLKSSITE